MEKNIRKISRCIKHTLLKHFIFIDMTKFVSISKKQKGNYHIEIDIDNFICYSKFKERYVWEIVDKIDEKITKKFFVVNKYAEDYVLTIQIKIPVK